MRKFGNRQKSKYISEKEEEAKIEAEKKSCTSASNNISSRLKFNFSYFRPETPGYDFSNLNADDSQHIINKLKEYSRESLFYWQSLDNYAKYDEFPQHSFFDEPENTPTGVEWGRFRVGAKQRIVGFTIPQIHHGKEIDVKGKKYYLDYNTFYIVFLDMDHKFYPTQRKGK